MPTTMVMMVMMIVMMILMMLVMMMVIMIVMMIVMMMMTCLLLLMPLSRESEEEAVGREGSELSREELVSILNTDYTVNIVLTCSHSSTLLLT